MGRNTSIAWAHHTANFWRGCSHAKWTDANGKEHVFRVCANSCYAENQVDHGEYRQLGVFQPTGNLVESTRKDADGKPIMKPEKVHLPIWGNHSGSSRIMGKSVWNDVRKWNREAESRVRILDSATMVARGEGVVTFREDVAGTTICHIDLDDGQSVRCTSRECESVRPRVFVSSLSDIFEDYDGPVVDGQGNELWYLVDLVKKTEFIGRYKEHIADRRLTLNDLRRDMLKLIDECQNLDFLLLTKRPQNADAMMRAALGFPSITPQFDNVWLGVSVENQGTLEWALRELASQTKWWRYTFLSAEPMIGPMDIQKALAQYGDGLKIDQIIIGGGSDQYRPADPFPVDDAKRLVDQCKAAGIAVFFKQFGSRPIPAPQLTEYQAAALSQEARHDYAEYRRETVDWCNRIKHPKGEDPSEWPVWCVQEFPQ